MDYLWTPWRYRYIAERRRMTAAFSATRWPRTTMPETLIVLRGEKNFIILNRYPYTSGHVMVVPYAHVADFAAAER